MACSQSDMLHYVANLVPPAELANFALQTSAWCYSLAVQGVMHRPTSTCMHKLLGKLLCSLQPHNAGGIIPASGILDVTVMRACVMSCTGEQAQLRPSGEGGTSSRDVPQEDGTEGQGQQLQAAQDTKKGHCSPARGMWPFPCMCCNNVYHEKSTAQRRLQHK